MNDSILHIKRTRFRFIWNLVLFLLFFACTETKKEKRLIAVQWNGEKAEAVSIPMSLLAGIAPDSIAGQLQVRLHNNPVAIIHERISLNNGSVTFEPLIAFTPGMKYDVLFSNKLIGQFEIPALNAADKPEVTRVYPTTDTLPENVLKLYVVFSKPMQEGQALKNIVVIKNGNDTLHSTFLDLEQELWNKDRTTLTLWFDPGRIKRDLQPNKNLGAPLEESNSYKLIIGQDWRDERGIPLNTSYQKNIVVGKKDSISPDPDKWTIHQPKAGTKEGLRIDLQESLDYVLLKNAIYVTSESGKTHNGSFAPAAKETILIFTPDELWQPGEYIINIESRLEDLAGNNLNRLFDKDLAKPDNREQKAIHSRKLRID